MLARLVGAAWLLAGCTQDVPFTQTAIAAPIPTAVDGGPGDAAVPADADACSRDSIPAKFAGCTPVDLDGKPPCELECSESREGNPPTLRYLVYAVYVSVAGRSPREIGRFKTYDGGPSGGGAPDATIIFVDRTTSPPTLELRVNRCLHDCWAAHHLDPSKPERSESECRAACPPFARHRYDGQRLQPVRAKK